MGPRFRRPSTAVRLAAFPHHGATPAQLFEAADAGQYAAKSAGRDCACVAGAADDMRLSA